MEESPSEGFETESLAIPPLDPLYLSSNFGFPLNDNNHDDDFNLTFDDSNRDDDFNLTFNNNNHDDDFNLFFDDDNHDDDFNLFFDELDQFYFLSDSDYNLPIHQSDINTCLNSSSPELDNLQNGAVSSGNSNSPISSVASPDSANITVDQKINNNVEETKKQAPNSSSPELDNFKNGAVSSGNSHSPISSVASPDSANITVDQKINTNNNNNVEETKKRAPKRKINDEEENDSTKCRRSSLTDVDNLNEDDKRKARLIRNRESAQLSRQRKKHYVEELEGKIRSMHSTITDLNNKIAYIMAENATFRQQLATGAPPQLMYPPVGYPWMPYAPPSVMNSTSSQVPRVPFPRLNPNSKPIQESVSKSKKNESKTKKVAASISLLGILSFILLFGCLVPILNVRYDDDNNENTPVGSGFVGDGHYSGRVLRVDSHVNGSNTKHKDYMGNGSELLTASLYVPINDKLVKIDGNLIIHSVLASEKAVASQIEDKDTGLAIRENFSPALAIRDARENGGKRSREYRKKPAERHMALSSGSADALKDHFKTTAADGKIRQWFQEGAAGPMLSSDMCTEVFQFDVSAPGAIIPASSATNISGEHRQNATHLNKGRIRRILHGLPVPLSGSGMNITQQQVGRNSRNENFQGNKTASSMVVSVLIDPREVGDQDMDELIVQKPLSRIFVVVLVDSVKYVTYSCVLPRSGPHLVAA